MTPYGSGPNYAGSRNYSSSTNRDGQNLPCPIGFYKIGNDCVKKCDYGYIRDEKGKCVKAIEIIAPDTPITDMAKYLECFDTTKEATITIYADQPKEGSGDAWTISWTGDIIVGHTFVSISQGTNTSVFGFYPSTKNNTSTTSPPEPSSMGNDSGVTFDVSISKNVSSDVLKKILHYATNYRSTYDLDNYNCSDFGIAIGNLAGLNLPDSYGSWLGGGGSNPGTLGQHIRNVTPSRSITTNTSGGKAPKNKKGC